MKEKPNYLYYSKALSLLHSEPIHLFIYLFLHICIDSFLHLFTTSELKPALNNL